MQVELHKSMILLMLFDCHINTMCTTHQAASFVVEVVLIRMTSHCMIFGSIDKVAESTAYI